MSERPFVIGVCGGIGSGKSVVRRVLGLPEAVDFVLEELGLKKK